MAVVTVAGLGLPASAFGSAAPAQPVVVGAVSNTAANAPHLSGLVSVAVSGHYAYTTAYWPGELSVVDISNPASPHLVGHTPATTSLKNGSNISIVGSDAFVVSKNRNASTTSDDDGSGNSLTVVDISNPTAPTVLGSVQDPNKLFGAYGIAVSGHYAFVGYQGVLPGQPHSPGTTTGGFSVIDLSNLSGGVVKNLDDASLPSPWTGQNVFKHATSVAISGNFAYVTAFNNSSVTVVNISNPTNPVIVASLHDPTALPAPVDLAVRGNDLYVVNQTFSNQFTVIDISNPSAPVVANSRSATELNGAYRIRIRGSFAYVSASSASTVAAIDLTFPTTPRLAGFVHDAGHLNFTTGLDVDSTGAYVIATSPFLSTESNVTFPPYPPAVPNTGTLSVIKLDPVPMSVSFVSATLPSNPTNSRSADIDFTASDAIYTAQCSLDGAPLAPCALSNSWQDSSLPVGSHTLTVQVSDTTGITAHTSYTWVVGSTPASTSGPTISGSAMQGNRLTVRLGSWTGYPAPTLSDRWQRCNRRGRACTDIPGATGTTYVATLGDVGSRLRVAVKGANGAGSATTRSGLTAVVVSNATASFTGIARRAASLHITVRGASGGAQITQVTVGLPNSIMRFGAPSARRLAAAVVVRNGASRRLGIRVAIRFGALVITLRKPAGRIHIAIAGTVFEVKNSFAQMTKRKKKPTATVVLDVMETRGVHTHDQLPARAS